MAMQAERTCKGGVRDMAPSRKQATLYCPLPTPAFGACRQGSHPRRLLVNAHRGTRRFDHPSLGCLDAPPTPQPPLQAPASGGGKQELTVRLPRREGGPAEEGQSRPVGARSNLPLCRVRGRLTTHGQARIDGWMDGSMGEAVGAKNPPTPVCEGYLPPTYPSASV